MWKALPLLSKTEVRADFPTIRYLADSNVAWGQDLKRLRRWMDERRCGLIGDGAKIGGSIRVYWVDKYWVDKPWWTVPNP